MMNRKDVNGSPCLNILLDLNFLVGLPMTKIEIETKISFHPINPKSLIEIVTKLK